MNFFTGRNHQVRIFEEEPFGSELATPFEAWCSSEQRHPDAPDSWTDFQLARLLSTGGTTPGAA